MIDNTYWNEKGTHTALYNKLVPLIPNAGACDNPRTSNRALEKLRRAANCYYDLYNNGLCNRAAEFRRIFGFGGTEISKGRYSNDHLINRLEAKMDEIILAAATEQKIS